MNNIAYFIASYGKPNRIDTLSAIKYANAQYPVYIVIGRDDPKIEEYKKTFSDNLLIFDKSDYIDRIDDIGIFSKTHNVCTYSRLAVHDFAKKLNIRYVVYLFDDIKYLQIRYISPENKVKSTKVFNLDRIIDLYVNLLNSDSRIVFVGAPQSSFYIGINKSMSNSYSSRYGNMFVYDVNNPPEILRSSILEDMDIVLQNNKLGKISICPFGLQVGCRDPHTTKDCYDNMTQSEYYQHCVLLGHKQVSLKRPTIPYVNFTPKIISDAHRRRV